MTELCHDVSLRVQAIMNIRDQHTHHTSIIPLMSAVYIFWFSKIDTIDSTQRLENKEIPMLITDLIVGSILRMAQESLGKAEREIKWMGCRKQFCSEVTMFWGIKNKSFKTSVGTNWRMPTSSEELDKLPGSSLTWVGKRQRTAFRKTVIS